MPGFLNLPNYRRITFLKQLFNFSTTGVDNVQDLHEKLAQLNREKMDIEAKLLSENQILAEKVSKMKERVSLLEEELQEAKRISSQTVIKLSNYFHKNANHWHFRSEI